MVLAKHVKHEMKSNPSVLQRNYFFFIRVLKENTSIFVCNFLVRFSSPSSGYSFFSSWFSDSLMPVTGSWSFCSFCGININTNTVKSLTTGCSNPEVSLLSDIVQPGTQKANISASFCLKHCTKIMGATCQRRWQTFLFINPCWRDWNQTSKTLVLSLKTWHVNIINCDIYMLENMPVIRKFVPLLFFYSVSQAFILFLMQDWQKKNSQSKTQMSWKAIEILYG